MQNLLHPEITPDDLGNISVLGLAHVGDAVYEILVRTFLVTDGCVTGSQLHHRTTEIVCAQAQASAAEKLMDRLTPEEAAIYRRGRNAGVKNIPANATHTQYSRATGLEALFGALYLLGQQERLLELFQVILEEPDDAT